MKCAINLFLTGSTIVCVFVCYQVSHVSTIGGSTVKECTRRLMRQMLTNSCARQLN